MKTITLKVHEAQDAELASMAKAEQISKGELIRRSLAEYLLNHPRPRPSKKRPSLHDRLKKYIPKAAAGIPDLSTNPKHLEGYGRD